MENYSDIDGKRLSDLCNKCCPIVQERLKKLYFVESYCKHNIYCRDGLYFPSWGCRSSFETLKECKLIIYKQMEKNMKFKRRRKSE